MPGICTCSSHCPLSGYHESGCCDHRTCDCWCHEKGAPRASVMPDDAFVEAARRQFDPETPGEREALLQRMGVTRAGGRG